jgi:hypothetical protein
MHDQYAAVGDPLESIPYLLTKPGRRKALALLASQIAKGTPINWAAQDALLKSGRRPAVNKTLVRR